MVKTESDTLYPLLGHPRLGLERLRDFDSALGSSKQHILVSNILRVGKGMGKITCCSLEAIFASFLRFMLGASPDLRFCNASMGRLVTQGGFGYHQI